MLKEIPETLMPCVFDPLQHDLGTDGTDDILLYLKKKKSIYKKYYKRTVQRCVLSVLSVPFHRWEQM